MTRSFNTKQVGIASGLVATTGLISMFSSLGLGIGLIRYIPHIKNEYICLINSSYTLSCTFCISASFISVAGIEYFSPELSFIQENIFYIVGFVLCSMATVLSSLVDQSLIAGRAARYVFIKNLLSSLIKLPLPILVFGIYQGYGIYFSVGISLLFGVLLGWFKFLPAVFGGYSPRVIFKKKLMYNMMPFAFSSYISNLFNQTPGFVYPLFVLNILGAEESAYFYITFMISGILGIIPSNLAQSFLAEGSNNPKSFKRDGLAAFGFSIVITSLAVVTMIFLGNWFLYFFGEEYQKNCQNLLRYLSLAVIPQCVNVFYMTINQIKRRKILIISQAIIFATIALISGNLLLMKKGLDGIALAYLLSHLIIAFVVIGPLVSELKTSANLHNYK